MKNHSVPVSFGVREDMDLLTSRGKHPPALSLESGLGDGGSSSLLPLQAGHCPHEAALAARRLQTALPSPSSGNTFCGIPFLL